MKEEKKKAILLSLAGEVDGLYTLQSLHDGCILTFFIPV